MSNDRNPYDHYCMCHGYTDKPCAKLVAESNARARTIADMLREKYPSVFDPFFLPPRERGAKS